MAKHKTRPCPVSRGRSVPWKGGFSLVSLYSTTLTLFQENRSFCCKSGQLLITSGSSISSQSLRRPEEGPSQVASLLRRKTRQCQWRCHKHDLPVNSHHCLSPPATVRLLLHRCFFFILEQQGAHHSNWFHGRKPGSGLDSS